MKADEGAGISISYRKNASIFKLLVGRMSTDRSRDFGVGRAQLGSGVESSAAPEVVLSALDL